MPRAILSPLLALAALAACSDPSEPVDMFTDSGDGADWPSYGRTYDESHFSPLTEIDHDTIGQLGLEWYADLPPGTAVGSALAVDGTVFITSGLSILRAFDAVTGEVLWVHDPDVAQRAGQELRAAWGARGIAYWQGRIYVGTMDGRLVAVDARTGELAWEAQTTEPGSGLYITGAPRAFDGLVVIGNGGADFAGVRGHVSAYDAETGEQKWKFFTVPGNPADGFENAAMEMAAQTWSGEWWEHGGGGTAWNAITYDPKYRLVYFGTGNGAPWNARIRSPAGGDNLFLCSILALDADTGDYRWHYQVNPAETWDFTATMDIQLATLTIDGEPRDVLMQAPKNGFFYVIDRSTGTLISAEAYTEQTWAERIDLATGRPVERPGARPNGNLLTIWPGSMGGHNWQPMSFSHRTGLVYIPTIELPGIYDDRGIDYGSWRRNAQSVVYDTGFNIGDLDVSAPPEDATFGTLTAWDPVAQEQRWSVPFRAPQNGGLLSTEGGLVFQGQYDGKFVARDDENGEELWSFDAQTGILSQPITYTANGRQFVTVLSGVAGSATILGPLAAEFGWTYRGQHRRVLTFALGGNARLPDSAPQPVEPLAADDFEVNQALADAGAPDFLAYCATCHGSAAISGGAGPDLRASVAVADWPAFYSIVNDGTLLQAGMPGFPDLEERKIRALQHYIRREAEDALDR